LLKLAAALSAMVPFKIETPLGKNVPVTIMFAPTFAVKVEGRFGYEISSGMTNIYMIIRTHALTNLKQHS